MPVATFKIISHQHHHVHSNHYYNFVSFVCYYKNVFKNSNSYALTTSVVIISPIGSTINIPLYTTITILACPIHENLQAATHPIYYLNKNYISLKCNDNLFFPHLHSIELNWHFLVYLLLIFTFDQSDIKPVNQVLATISDSTYLHQSCDEYKLLCFHKSQDTTFKHVLKCTNVNLPINSVNKYDYTKYNVKLTKTELLCENILLYIDSNLLFVLKYFYPDKEGIQECCFDVLLYTRKDSNDGSIIRNSSERNKNEGGCYPTSGGNKPSLHENGGILKDMSRTDSTGKRAVFRLNPINFLLMITEGCNLMNPFISSSTTQAQCARYPCPQNKVRL